MRWDSTKYRLSVTLAEFRLRIDAKPTVVLGLMSIIHTSSWSKMSNCLDEYSGFEAGKEGEPNFSAKVDYVNPRHPLRPPWKFPWAASTTTLP